MVISLFLGSKLFSFFFPSFFSVTQEHLSKRTSYTACCLRKVSLRWAVAAELNILTSTYFEQGEKKIFVH